MFVNSQSAVSYFSPTKETLDCSDTKTLISARLTFIAPSFKEDTTCSEVAEQLYVQKWCIASSIVFFAHIVFSSHLKESSSENWGTWLCNKLAQSKLHWIHSALTNLQQSPLCTHLSCNRLRTTHFWKEVQQATLQTVTKLSSMCYISTPNLTQQVRQGAVHLVLPLKISPLRFPFLPFCHFN